MMMPMIKMTVFLILTTTSCNRRQELASEWGRLMTAGNMNASANNEDFGKALDYKKHDGARFWLFLFISRRLGNYRDGVFLD